MSPIAEFAVPSTLRVATTNRWETPRSLPPLPPPYITRLDRTINRPTPQRASTNSDRTIRTTSDDSHHRETPPLSYITNSDQTSINRPTPLVERVPTNSDQTITSTSDNSHRSALKKIAEETLTAIREGGYFYRGVDQDLTEAIKEAKSKTIYYSPSSYVKRWASSTKPNPTHSLPTHISILHITSLDAARHLENISNPFDDGKIGILNFASPRYPGGNFKNGSDSQETSIARSSTLYPALKADEVQQFYKLYTRENAEIAAPYYLNSHGMIYSPNISIFRDDEGNWTSPFLVDVLSCAAVNAGKVRRANGISLGQEVEIEKEMSERMGRILYLFERKGVRNIILGAFGTGVFHNGVGTVARIWAQLLLVPEARFKDSFERIIFAIKGEETFRDFQSAFNAWKPRVTGLRRSSNRSSDMLGLASARPNRSNLRQSRRSSVWLETDHGPGLDA